MFAKFVPLLVTALAFCLIFAVPGLAPDPLSYDGVVVSAAAGKLTMKDTAGKDHGFTVEPTAKITVNGKPGKLDDLKAGVKIKVMTDAEGKVLSIATVDDMKGR